jgi:hypothetical protein
MTRRRGHEDEPQAPRKLSRGDIETLCVLYVVGEGGCPARDLAGRLGLSPSIAPEIAAGMDSLVTAGLLDLEEDRFSLTEAGRVRLANRAGTDVMDLFAFL